MAIVMVLVPLRCHSGFCCRTATAVVFPQQISHEKELAAQVVGRHYYSGASRCPEADPLDYGLRLQPQHQRTIKKQRGV